jgi:hypothetical protein
MHKLGIMVSDLGATQLSYYLINNINKFLDSHYDVDITVFFDNLNKHSFTCNFACMQTNECWGYDGPTIATNVKLAQLLIKVPTIQEKFFYIWQPEWVIDKDNRYQYFYDTYHSPQLKLICEPNYQNLIGKLWDVDVTRTVKDFNIDEMLKWTKPT